MAEPDEKAPETPQEAAGAPADDLAGLDPHVRQLVEHERGETSRAHAESAGRRHEIADLRKQLEKLQRERESDQDRAIREAVEHATGEMRTYYERQLATLTIQAQAADRFQDPGDAVRMLDLDELLAETDTAKRQAAVEKALAALLEAKPYLARGAANHRPLVSQGARTEQTGRPTREGDWLRGRR
jgi:hypothetical protein